MGLQKKQALYLVSALSAMGLIVKNTVTLVGRTSKLFHHVRFAPTQAELSALSGSGGKAGTKQQTVKASSSDAVSSVAKQLDEIIARIDRKSVV